MSIALESPTLAINSLVPNVNTPIHVLPENRTSKTD